MTKCIKCGGSTEGFKCDICGGEAEVHVEDLKRRYFKGEIDNGEFARMKKDLESKNKKMEV